MIKNIDLGKNYALYLLPLYGGIKNNVTVIGKTNIDNVAMNEDEYNIYETYFQPLGLGLTSYYTAIQQDTEIYICKPITSLEPFTIGDEKVFIPKSLIDMSESVEYVEAYNFNFQIYPIVKRFDSESTRDSFKEEITEKIRIKLKELIDFNTLEETAVGVSYDTVYVTKETIEAMENRSTKMWNEWHERLRKNRDGERLMEEQYNQTLNEMREAINENTRSAEEYHNKVAVLDAEIKRYRDAIAGMQNNG
jgi:hypothetical protein